MGTKTRQSVPVVQKMMKIDIMTYETSCSSARMNETAPPITHIITTLYTLIPAYAFTEKKTTKKIIKIYGIRSSAFEIFI